MDDASQIAFNIGVILCIICLAILSMLHGTDLSEHNDKIKGLQNKVDNIECRLDCIQEN